jgi:hypothetical protein
MLFQSIIALILIQCINAEFNQKNWECSVLKIIYQNMGRDLSETDCCQAPGITCRDQNIVKIDWSGHNLTGSIPAEFIYLQHLKFFFFFFLLEQEIFINKFCVPLTTRSAQRCS